MCLPLVIWWTCSAVTTVFEIEPVSGPLEVFLLQGNSQCPDVRDNLKALPFFCKVGGGRWWRHRREENLLGTSLKVFSGRSTLERWHVEVRELKIHSLTTSYIQVLLKKSSWTSTHRYAHPGLKPLSWRVSSHFIFPWSLVGYRFIDDSPQISL